ncbi:hypothetical protein ABVV53_08750 [Novosphingobium sp. RD2P27]|uniref:Uncharacterized protein n=1 Tax=Novosphingobium kalidii TaxID=3230299 RepID=A0ABV2D125_9SPHN
MSHATRHVDRHHIRFRPSMRMPILSNGSQARVTFTCWEKQQRVIGQLHQRYRGVELVRTDDAFILDYIALQRHKQLGSVSRPDLLELAVTELCAYYELAPCAEEQIVDGLRRATGTLLTFDHWKERHYPRKFPLVEARRRTPGRFTIKTSAWLDDELMDGEVVSAPRHTSQLPFTRFRLDGWGRSWVGRNRRTNEQIITQRDALARVGPLPDRMPGTPWEHLLAVVEANDLQDFNLAVIEHRGRPAISVEERKCSTHGLFRDPELMRSLSSDDGGIGISLNDEPASSSWPAEITLAPEEPEPEPACETTLPHVGALP